MARVQFDGTAAGGTLLAFVSPMAITPAMPLVCCEHSNAIDRSSGGTPARTRRFASTVTGGALIGCVPHDGGGGGATLPGCNWNGCPPGRNSKTRLAVFSSRNSVTPCVLLIVSKTIVSPGRTLYVELFATGVTTGAPPPGGVVLTDHVGPVVKSPLIVTVRPLTVLPG